MHLPLCEGKTVVTEVVIESSRPTMFPSQWIPLTARSRRREWTRRQSDLLLPDPMHGQWHWDAWTALRNNVKVFM